MVRQSVLNDCLNNIVNAEKAGKRQVLIRPSSKVIIKFLEVMQKHGKLNLDGRRDVSNTMALLSATARISSLQTQHRTDNSTPLILRRSFRPELFMRGAPFSVSGEEHPTQDSGSSKATSATLQ